MISGFLWKLLTKLAPVLAGILGGYLFTAYPDLHQAFCAQVL